jgi:hypothetical protein
MEHLLIDGIGPFFRGYKPKRINWSKVPFAHIETTDAIATDRARRIVQDFSAFVQKVAPLGITGVTLDDVAHVVPSDLYAPDLQSKIASYRELYATLCDVATAAGLDVFLTTDVMFYTDSLARALGDDPRTAASWLTSRIDQLFHDFPAVRGLVVRIGESDGIDVEGDFQSRLVLRTAPQANAFLRALLPVFEKHGRLLIFRTWSVGAHPVGDLIWNRNTFDRVFADVHSDALIISMKYGESDFFRYLPVNKLFYRTPHRRMIELQTRREYEGFGDYPSFVGFYYEQILNELRENIDLAGALLWCQTGGWGKTRRLTYIHKSSVWVELNTAVTAGLCRGKTCEQAVREFCERRPAPIPETPFLRFLRLSDTAICDLLYIREFAMRKMFFRRLRIPPLLYVYWDRIILNYMIRKLLRWLVHDHAACLAEGRRGYAALEQMVHLAEEHGLPKQGLEYQVATFTILLAAREYFFTPYAPDMKCRLKQLKKDYRHAFKRQYSIHLSFKPRRLTSRQVRWFYLMFFRNRRGYRLLDRIVALRLLSWAFPLVRWIQNRVAPKFARTQAMGIEAVFK